MPSDVVLEAIELPLCRSDVVLDRVEVFELALKALVNFLEAHVDFGDFLGEIVNSAKHL